MKKCILTTLLLVSSYALMAKLPINIGIHGGINNTRLKISTFEEVKTSARMGYMIGAFGRLNLGPVYVEPSFNYSHKQSEVDDETVKYNAFDIPVMLGVSILDFPIFKLRAFVGPVASFTGKIKIEDTPSYKIDNDKTMWSGKAGLGVDVWKFTFDVDYEKGFKKFQNNGNITIKSPSVFNFTLGFKIL